MFLPLFLITASQRLKNTRTSPEEAEAENLADLGIGPSPPLASSAASPYAPGNAEYQHAPVTAGSSLVDSGTGVGGGLGAPEVDLLGLMGGDEGGGVRAGGGQARGGGEFQKGAPYKVLQFFCCTGWGVWNVVQYLH